MTRAFSNSLAAVAVAAVVLALAHGSPGQDVAETSSRDLAVEILTVVSQPDVRTLSLTGEVAARDTLSAAFPTSGRISEMRVNRGDKVVKGQPLARIDATQQAQALRAAQAALASARAGETKARDDALRQDGLLAQGTTTRSARDAAADTLSAAEGAVAQALADLDRAQKALGDTELAATSDGTVIDRFADVGQVVGAAQPVLKLALGDRFDAVFDLPEGLFTSLKNEPVTVRLSPVDRPDLVVSGVPRQISPLVDATKGTVRAKVAMESLPAGTRFGDAIVGTIDVTGEPRIMLPWSAMSATAEGPAVWVVDAAQQTVALRQVTVLRYETGRIVLSGGLKDGDRVVGRGSNLLFPGRSVRAAEGF